MTQEEIRETIRPLKPCSLVQLRRYIRELKIPAVGRTRPKQYPSDAAGKILEHLGFVQRDREYRLPTMAELRNERRKATMARRAA